MRPLDDFAAESERFVQSRMAAEEPSQPYGAASNTGALPAADEWSSNASAENCSRIVADLEKAMVKTYYEGIVKQSAAIANSLAAVLPS